MVPLLLGVGLEVVEDGRSDEQVGEGAHHQGQGADVLLLHFAAAAVIWRTAASLFLFHQPTDVLRLDVSIKLPRSG